MKEVDVDHTTSEMLVEKVYAIKEENDYYKHHCVCKICGHKSVRSHKLEHTKKKKEFAGLDFTNRTRRTGSSGGRGGSGSSSEGSGRDNPFTPFNQQESGNTCGYCRYYDAGSCKYYDSPQYVNFNSKACWNFS